MALIDKLASIANAIREKTGNIEKLTLDQMVSEILGFSSSSGVGMKDYFTARASDGHQFNNYKGNSETLANLLAYGDTSAVTSMSYMFQSCSSLTTIPQLDTSAVTTMNSMFQSCSSLTTIPQLDTSAVTNMNSMFQSCYKLTTIPQLDTSAVTSMNDMFNGCVKLTTIPQLDTSAVTSMSYMFQSCSSLTTIPQLDTSAVTTMNSMFQSCSSLTTIPQLDTSAVTNMYNMFNGCTNLTTIPQLDTSKVTNMNKIFQSCYKLTDCLLRNIKTNLQVGSGTSYGHLLTLDSLLFMIGELIDTGSSKTFTVGSANIEKLADVYVKTITITDEMRAEDPYIDQKLPFEVCESTDEGAALIVQYVKTKNWQLAS